MKTSFSKQEIREVQKAVIYIRQFINQLKTGIEKDGEMLEQLQIRLARQEKTLKTMMKTTKK